MQRTLGTYNDALNLIEQNDAVRVNFMLCGASKEDEK
jgi:hypothetical protein